MGDLYDIGPVLKTTPAHNKQQKHGFAIFCVLDETISVVLYSIFLMHYSTSQVLFYHLLFEKTNFLFKFPCQIEQ